MRNQNKNGRSKDTENAGQKKKPFNKKTYRLKKYSNKYKVDQWEDRRKKAVLRNYYKEVHKNEAKPEINSLASKSTPKEAEGTNPEKSQFPKKQSAFFMARQEFLKKKEEKKRRREEMLKMKAEKEEALRKYKQKRMQMYKKLSKKTKKGQPVMKDRMEMLLDKIRIEDSDSFAS